MKNTKEFIEKYLTPYLSLCHSFNPLIERIETTPVPPNSEELYKLIEYLMENDIDFAIVGSIAVARYLELTNKDVHQGFFRPTNALEILVVNALPAPLKGWKVVEKPKLWFNPKTNSYVQFFNATEIFPQEAPFNVIGKDPLSVRMGCPIADPLTLFKMKLDSGLTKDILELTYLIEKIGFPSELENQLWNKMQITRLKLIKSRLSV